MLAKLALMKYYISFLLVFTGLYSISIAQDKLCGTSQVVNEAIKNNPSLQSLMDNENKKALKYTQNNYGSKSGNNYVIPIVFHVMHNYGGENVSKAQIEDAVRIINEDFQKLNSDTTQIVSQFAGIAADSEIEFRLAQIDPWGNCTEGITRHQTLLTYEAGENVKNIVSWNTGMYLNVWVVANIASGAGAYAYYPGTAPGASHEGIVCRASQLGSIGASGGSNFAARTLTHEIGHYLNLPHTWGSSNNNAIPTNCNSDDWVTDTPNTIGSNQNCNLSQNTCGSLDNVQNYMDYATCSKMFTYGQKARMHAALNSSAGSRNTLWTNSNRIATGTNDGFTPTMCAPIVDFDYDHDRVCEGDSVHFEDLTYNATIDPSWTWAWTFQGGNPASSSLQNPAVYYGTPGTYDVTLTVTNSGGNDSYTKTGVITVGATSGGELAPFAEGMENSSFPSHPSDPLKDWVIDNFSSSGWNRTTNAAATGTASMRINNWIIPDGDLNSFYSPTIDFSNVSVNDAYMRFKVAYARRDTNSKEVLKVWVSTNCGQYWNLRFAKGAADLSSTGGNFVTGSFVPNSTQWVEFVSNFTMYAGEPDLLVKFEMKSENGNYLYIDDINIGNGPSSVEELNQAFNYNVYPNPITNQSIIEYQLFDVSKVRFQLFDLLGNKIDEKELTLPAGEYQDNFLQQQKGLAKGAYLLKLSVGEQDLFKKVVY